MQKTKKTQSPMAWVLGQTGDHGGQYILSVALAIIGVAFSLAPYFVVIGVVQGLMDGVKDFSFLPEPLPDHGGALAGTGAVSCSVHHHQPQGYLRCTG